MSVETYIMAVDCNPFTFYTEITFLFGLDEVVILKQELVDFPSKLPSP